MAFYQSQQPNGSGRPALPSVPQGLQPYVGQQQQQPPRQLTPVLPPLPPEFVEEQRREQYRRQQTPVQPGFIAQGPAIVSPRPQHLPSHIPAGKLESRASEIGAVPPYQLQPQPSPSLQFQPPSPAVHHQPSPFASQQSLPQAYAASPAPINEAQNYNWSMPQPDLSQSQPSRSRPDSFAGGGGGMPDPSTSFAALSLGGPSGVPSHMQSHVNQNRRTSAASTSALPNHSYTTDVAAQPRRSSLTPNPPPQRSASAQPVMPAQNGHRQSLSQSHSRHTSADYSQSGRDTRLALSLPSEADIAALHEQAFASAINPSDRAVKKVKWAKEVFRYLERHQSGSSISNPRWVTWVDDAVKSVIAASTSMPPVPEALYLKADLAMAGTFPTIVPKDPKSAFRGFEAAANAEYAPAWYRIGREYEQFNDFGRASDAYQKGINLGDVTCTYRMGMALLLGQLGLKPDIRSALDMLRTSATIAEQINDPEFAAPLYVWGMVLAGEFEAPSVSLEALPKDVFEAGRCMRKAAYLCHAPAQNKMGAAYEFAQLGYTFDPFMSVQYYTLASQQGETEADMALSKWFLVGAENCFSANEDLAFTFADKAARKGLASAEFALGYYCENGIGTSQNISSARKWYEKALAQGNEDAKGRLNALNANAAMSRREHESHTAALMRTRTQARIRSENRPAPSAQTRPSHSLEDSPPSVEVRRKQTMKRVQQAASSYTPSPRVDATPSKSSSEQHPVNRISLADSGTMSIADTLPKQGKGPRTFSEMGIESTKLQKSECIIM